MRHDIPVAQHQTQHCTIESITLQVQISACHGRKRQPPHCKTKKQSDPEHCMLLNISSILHKATTLTHTPPQSIILPHSTPYNLSTAHYTTTTRSAADTIPHKLSGYIPSFAPATLHVSHSTPSVGQTPP